MNFVTNECQSNRVRVLIFSESDYSSSFDDQEILDLDQMLNATDNDKNIRFEWGDAIKVSFYWKILQGCYKLYAAKFPGHFRIW